MASKLYTQAYSDSALRPSKKTLARCQIQAGAMFLEFPASKTQQARRQGLCCPLLLPAAKDRTSQGSPFAQPLPSASEVPETLGQ